MSVAFGRSIRHGVAMLGRTATARRDASPQTPIEPIKTYVDVIDLESRDSLSSNRATASLDAVRVKMKRMSPAKMAWWRESATPQQL